MEAGETERGPAHASALRPETACSHPGLRKRPPNATRKLLEPSDEVSGQAGLTSCSRSQPIYPAHLRRDASATTATASGVFPLGVGQGYRSFADPEASSPRRRTQWITPKQMQKDVYADDGLASVVILAGSLLDAAEKLLATVIKSVGFLVTIPTLVDLNDCDLAIRTTISWDARQINWVIAGSMAIMAILTIIVSA
ncbi:hypothetical protein PtA15_6A373 [Puccinia triticina]|uniref:Uncharacterized protein n=1 Tax=Puccinia triticina TaxID=208348 RepID=A0ABY7CKS7_9BASI|nr:uncharacterized protein PtA15_6A373 [Puccinia triticina]WAQ85744.1 hypothetical protein PtA15_6A373 [Puccinia triticina]